MSVERLADEILINAIGVMKTMNDCYGELTEPFDIVKYKFLQELKEYRDTGLAPEQVRELAEKQKPMKVEKLKSAQYPYRCPACGYLLEIGYKHCISCGQRVKYEWEEVR